MPTSDTPTELALAAAAGDRAALSSFIRATQADVWRFVAGLAGTDAADDLTQETFLRVLPALAAFEGRSSARTWLLVIARRVVVDWRRHHAARPPLSSAEWSRVLDSARFATHQVSSLDTEAVLSVLDADRREALVLTQLLGFSYAEAAVIADCPVGTIRSRVARARADLVQALQRDLDAARV